MLLDGQIVDLRQYPATAEKPAQDVLRVYSKPLRDVVTVRAHHNGWAEGEEFSGMVRPYYSERSKRIEYQELREQ